VWDDEHIDVALLRLTDEELPPGWCGPDAPGKVAAQVGEEATLAEAIGFPELAVRPDGVRKPEQPPGVIQPAPAVRDEHNLMPFDIDSSHPDSAALWQGMSGGPVRERASGPANRLLGLVVRADPKHQQRRLYMVAFEDLAARPGFREAATEVGWDAVVESRFAPLWRKLVPTKALTPEAVPPLVATVSDLGVFGVKAAVADDTGGSVYPPYLHRTADAELVIALDEAAAGGRRLVLVSGDSASGKSRTAAEGVRHHDQLGTYRLVVPYSDGGVRKLSDEGLGLDHTLVWLDDIDKHLGSTSPDVVRTLLERWPSAVVVATIRAEHLRGTGERDLADPVQELLTNQSIVHRVRLSAELDDTERAGARTVFTNPLLQNA